MNLPKNMKEAGLKGWEAYTVIENYIDHELTNKVYFKREIVSPSVQVSCEEEECEYRDSETRECNDCMIHLKRLDDGTNNLQCMSNSLQQEKRLKDWGIIEST